MRLVHTADWHVGKTLRGQSRLDESARALDQLLDIVRETRADALLVAGDVFDQAAPPPDAERLVYDFLARLSGERVACVLIAGNHDHPRRLEALARLVEGLGIHIRAEARPADSGGIVTIPSRDGAERAAIAVLPFVPERKIVDACQVLSAERVAYESYAARLEQLLSRLTRGLRRDTVNIALAHLTVAGARAGTGERALHLGEIYCIQAQQLPDAFQYVALGHLHRPQEILAPARAAYSGSLLELDFGETEQDKRVVLVTASPGKPARLESIPITAGCRLLDVEGRLDEVLAQGASLAEAFLRVTVQTDGPAPGIAEQVRERLPRAVDVRVSYEHAPAPAEQEDVRRTGLEPAELLSLFYRTRLGAEPRPEVLQLFREMYEQALQDGH